MSYSARLARLETTVTATVTPENRGANCRACGGLRIDDVMLAIDTLDRADTHGAPMTAEAAKVVCDALTAGEAACRKCGDVTLAGTADEMLKNATEEPAV